MRKGLAVLGLGLIAWPLAASNALAITIFGDSLSDTGNLYVATGGAQPPAGQPYFNGRFSDGPLWVETLAAGLGNAADAAPALLGGRNYAFAGARTGTGGSPPGVLAQVAGLWAPTNPVADPNELFVVTGGFNDLRDARSAFSTLSAADNFGRQLAAEAAISNLFSALSVLASRGVQNVLVSNIGDLGLTPEAVGLGLAAASSDVSNRFNALLPTLLSGGASLGLNMYFLDANSVFSQIRNDALNNGGALYGITNVLTPCAGFVGSIGAACSVSAFSDALHPSARVHQLLGQAALAAVTRAQVHEPATLGLLGIGLVALGFARRRKV